MSPEDIAAAARAKDIATLRAAGWTVEPPTTTCRQCGGAVGSCATLGDPCPWQVDPLRTIERGAAKAERSACGYGVPREHCHVGCGYICRRGRGRN